MRNSDHNWGLILAGGEGRRLAALTTTRTGMAIPKQYCSLRGGPSLLQEALQRANSIIPLEHICAVVADRHRSFWQPALSSLRADNVLVEPQSRGTATGILFGLIHILKQDPDGTVMILPADHYVHDEVALMEAMRTAIAYANKHPTEVLLLGMEPDEPDSELGYIVPRTGADNDIEHIELFVEKPAHNHARELISAGAMWNAFIIVAKASALLNEFETRHPNVATKVRDVLSVGTNRSANSEALSTLYLNLPYLDFSRDVIESNPSSNLRLVRTPRCGWSDLGTPKRVRHILQTYPVNRHADWSKTSAPAPMNLSQACEQRSTIASHRGESDAYASMNAPAPHHSEQSSAA